MFFMRKFLYLIVSLVAASIFANGNGGLLLDPVYAEQQEEESSVGFSNVISDRKGDECVEPTLVMRRKHMDLLFHQRDETMYRGIRTKRHSLKACVSCHAKRYEQGDNQGQAVPVSAPDQFCQKCHQYVAVNIDCFGCHAATPEGKYILNE